MLVALGPPFEATDDQYARLARATGMVAYDLRTKLKPGYWGVVRALGDADQAQSLAERLRAEGFRVAVVDPMVGHEPERKFVALHGLAIDDDGLTLRLRGREMMVPWSALLLIVRGEVQLGGKPPTSMRPQASSSSTFRAVVPSASDVAVFRELHGGTFDAFAAADLHFVTVSWVARIDARSFDFGSLGGTPDGPASALDKLVDDLAARSGARVDRGSKTSSLLSFTNKPAHTRVHTPPPTGAAPPPSLRPSAAPPGGFDERFDAYSRLVGEAERQTRRQR